MSEENNNPYCKCEADKYPLYCKRHCMLKGKGKHNHCKLTTNSGLKYWNEWERGNLGACEQKEPILDLVVDKKKIKRAVRDRRILQSNKNKSHWTTSFTSACPSLGLETSKEPCTCGASSKISVHRCLHPDNKLKLCVSNFYDWNRLKDPDLKPLIRCCDSCELKDHSIRFVTTKDFDLAIKKLISKLPPDIERVIGISRSGMYPASAIAMYLHVPLHSINQKTGDTLDLGSGWRLGNKRSQGKILVVDDTCMTGNSLREVQRTLQIKDNVIYSTVFVNPLSRQVPEYWGEILAWPHLLEWNLFNSVISPSVATDFDGILCRDCLPQEDDDGSRYLNFINNAEPTIYRPKKVPIPLIVTARIERYREATVNWLNNHEIKFHQLIMHPAKNLQDRRKDNIAKFKAEQFVLWAKKHTPRPGPTLFIESDVNQAKLISKYSKFPVICPAAGKVFNDIF